MKITPADMAGRKRMSALRSSLTEAIAIHDGISYGELLSVLADVTARWAVCLRRDELNEPDCKEDET